MSNISYSDAFNRYGAKLSNPRWAVSAIAEDGSLVLSCWSHLFSRPNKETLRYTDKLSRWGNNTPGNNLLRAHLTQAVQTNLPIRLVIVVPTEKVSEDYEGDGSTIKKTFNCREDLTGRISEFDGDQFVVDFQRKRPTGA